MKHEQQTDSLMLAIEAGIRTTHLSYEIGAGYSYVSHVASGRHSASPARAKLLKLALKRRARRLQRVNPTQKSIAAAIESSGIQQLYLANKLGVSKQAVHKYLTLPSPPSERLKELADLLKELGRELEASL